MTTHRPLWTVALAAALALGAGAALRAAVEPPPAAVPAPERAARVAVLLSDDDAPHQEFLAGVREALEPRGSVASLDVPSAARDATAAAKRLEDLAARGRPALLITAGSVATRAGLERLPDTPIVAGLILDAEEIRAAPRATGVVLTLPAETEWRFLRRILPAARRVGVVYHEPAIGARMPAAREAAARAGLTLRERSIESAIEVADAVQGVARDSDVLWGVPDPMVLNARTARSILTLSLQLRVPLIGPSRNWVEAGALYALDRDYRDIGRQCGEMALQILRGASPASLPPAAPRRVVCYVNPRTAREMKIAIPADVLREAQALGE